jgi:hypothetical protein
VGARLLAATHVTVASPNISDPQAPFVTWLAPSSLCFHCFCFCIFAQPFSAVHRNSLHPSFLIRFIGLEFEGPFAPPIPLSYTRGRWPVRSDSTHTISPFRFVATPSDNAASESNVR